jgi:hypothetical protein
MIKSKYQADGFAAIVIKNKAHIIGAVKAGQDYAYASNVRIIFNLTLPGLTADLEAQGLTILS